MVERIRFDVISGREELTKFAFGKVLDIGIGDAFPWRNRKPENVVGFDIQLWEGFVDVVGDARYLPFKDKSFDTVTCFEVIEHIPPEDRDRVLKEMVRVAKYIIIISVPSRHPVNFRAAGREDWRTINPHWKHPDWLFTDDTFIDLVSKIEGTAFLFKIKNEYYDGYGAVIFLL